MSAHQSVTVALARPLARGTPAGRGLLTNSVALERLAEASVLRRGVCPAGAARPAASARPRRLSKDSESGRVKYGACFAVAGSQGSSVVLTGLRAYASIRVNRESCTGCRRILSEIASRGLE